MVEPRPRDEIDKLYKTNRWRKLRKVIIARDYGMCQECKRRGLVVKGVVVHHIIEAREDITKFWDEENLELVCLACHNKDHPERSGGEKRRKTKRKVVKFYANRE
ncbi:HNH endonuclease signature motif containing protein [Enterococcus avium]|uniref:HNH endonuclease n=1 Tax=Enterococcus avium TaxID=33945 RepID=UPI00288D2907|nr:HNH endonuclease signature motif containing protein [Enterococcus avium]MDT2419506.1 HNH endonuclease signature motif containing protein [Enterococcus avium]MDT2432416.1 HNH endonuclease signature motif containing protein [Enterococcus avium]